MKEYKVTGIKWDTDGEDVNLPTDTVIKSEEKDFVIDDLSDEYGYAINSVDSVIELENNKYSYSDVREDFKSISDDFFDSLEIQDLPKKHEYQTNNNTEELVFTVNKKYVSSMLLRDMKDEVQHFDGGDFSISVDENEKEVLIIFTLIGATSDEINYSEGIITSLYEFKQILESREKKVTKNTHTK